MLLKEKLTSPKIAGACLSVIGVITCVQPWLINSDSQEDVTKSHQNHLRIRNSKNFLRPLFHYINTYENIHETWVASDFNETNVTTVQPILPEDDGLDEIFGYIMAATAGVVISFGNILIKFRLQEVSPSHLNLYAGALGTIIPLIISLSTENIVFPTEDWDIVYLCGQVTEKFYRLSKNANWDFVSIMRASCFNTDFASHMRLAKFLILYLYL